MSRLMAINQITSKNLLDLESALCHEDDSAIIYNIQTNQILLANTLACKNLGYMKNEIIGADISAIISNKFSPIKTQESKHVNKISIEICQFIAKSGFSFIAERKIRKMKIDKQTYHLVCFKDLVEIVTDSSIKNETKGLIPFYKKILNINQEVLCVNQDMFFKNMVYSLSNKLNVRWVMICKLIQSQGTNKSQVLSMWDQSKFQSEIVYDLKGTPCEKAYKTKEVFFCNKDVIKIFPKDLLAIDWGVESYLGVPILSDKGDPLGVLVAMDDKPMQENQYMENRAIMELFSLRCSNEIILDSNKHKIEFSQPLKSRLESSKKYKSLSKREFEVFKYLASGLSSKSIAEKIAVTLPTVKFHLKNIYKKLDIKGRKGVLELYAQYVQ